MIYGHDKTIHRTGDIDVEVDRYGKVVSVWFRCLSLPFTQTVVGEDRAHDMESMYRTQDISKILAIEIEDKI